VLTAAVAVAAACAGEARADGRVFHRPAPGPAGAVSTFLTSGAESRNIRKAGDPVIPDQTALISYRDGRETLVIQTAFRGEGTDFAWVVPTPAVPEIQAAPEQLLSSLSYSTSPDLISEVPDLRLAGLVFLGGLLVARHARREGPKSWRRAVAGAAVAALVVQGAAGAAAIPGISLAGPVGGFSLPTTPREELVEVRQRAQVSGYDTVTLAATDPHALAVWLAGHGYSVPAGLEDVAAAYVRDGWVFNAIRLRRDGNTAATNAIEPISFTFATAKPVYPMRLTGLTTHPVDVRLLVAGPARAVADGFATVHCSELTTSPDRSSGAGVVAVDRGQAGRFLDRTRVLTRLDRTFRPEEMGADVDVRFEPYSPTDSLVFSERAAKALGGNLGAFVAIGAFIGLASADGSRKNRASSSRRRRWISTAIVMALSLAVAVSIATFLPQAETRSAAAATR
jgi:hypothetical protein